MANFEQTSLKDRWCREFEKCVDYDSWGQVIEAAEGYQKVAASLHDVHEASLSNASLTPEDLGVIRRLCVIINKRRAVLERRDSAGPALKDMKTLVSAFRSLFLKKGTVLATILDEIDPPALPQAIPSTVRNTHTLTPVSSEHGGTLLSVVVERIGIKNATQYIDPFITVFVADAEGNVIEPPQDSPISNRKTESYIEYHSTIQLPSSVESWGQGAAVFFEFKHFKPRKNKISTRGWAFMEMDELKHGATQLEIYKKPTDLKRQKIKLLSVKPLFLHLNLTLQK